MLRPEDHGEMRRRRAQPEVSSLASRPRSKHNYGLTSSFSGSKPQRRRFSQLLSASSVGGKSDLYVNTLLAAALAFRSDKDGHRALNGGSEKELILG